MGTTPSVEAQAQAEDGIAGVDVMSYTEKLLEEKELQLKKYIQENYSKLRDVEREFEKLTLELKLTAGPKKAALELFRKKIEQSTEKIKLAKQKEEQARKVWEEAKKALKQEEAEKKRICEDLNSLVQESASAQYSRLEELKRRLEALNPETKGDCTTTTSMVPNNETTSMTTSSEQQNKSETCASAISTNSSSLPDHSSNSKLAKDPSSNKGIDKSDPSSQGQPSKPILGRQPAHMMKGRNHNAARGKGTLVLQKPKDETGWNGAGFDVDSRS